MRALAILVHRYAGLAMAAFLVVAAVTGSLLAFNHELEAILAPELRRIASRPPEASRVDPFALRERLVSMIPGATVDWVPLHFEPGASISFFAEGPRDPSTGEPAPLEDDEYFFDPFTGELLGRRKWGDVTQGPKNWMPFTYRLHYSLAIPGDVGFRLFGIVALVWTLDCFVGFLLTLPRRRAAGPRGFASFARRWKPAWQVRWRSRNLWRFNFDVHRATGLWLWGAFFVFAWSGVGLNLGEVYRPVMHAAFGMVDVYDSIPDAAVATREPAIPWRDALVIARRHAAAQAKVHDFTIVREDGLGYDAAKNVFRYRLKSDRDVYERFAQVNLYFGAEDGAFRGIDLPTGRAAGNTITAWLYALHFGDVFGLPYRIFVAVLGGAVAILSLSGVLVWWKKRRRPLFAFGADPRRIARGGTNSLARGADRTEVHGLDPAGAPAERRFDPQPPGLLGDDPHDGSGTEPRDHVG